MSGPAWMLLALLLPGGLWHPPLQAQEVAPVNVGARVRVTAPVFGKGMLQGRFARAKLRGRSCDGVALDRTDPSGNPMFVLLKGITRLEVDRRTNQGYYTVGLPEAADSDWAVVPLVALARADSACAPPR